jgi:hypothetical protein
MSKRRNLISASDYFWQAVRFDRLTEEQKDKLEAFRLSVVSGNRIDALALAGNFIGDNLKQSDNCFEPQELRMLHTAVRTVLDEVVKDSNVSRYTALKEKIEKIGGIT